jgi:nitronate monooxygenase
MAADRGFMELVGCWLPLQLASLGGPVRTSELAAAVSEAGGLGMIPNPSSAAEVDQRVASARALITQPIGVGFLIPFLSADALAAAAAGADVVEFFSAIPIPISSELPGVRGRWQGGRRVRPPRLWRLRRRVVTSWVVQGTEAGGHVRGNQRLDEVLAETLANVDIPVVAAGGVGTPQRVARLLETGEAGVRVGTRFVVAEAADAPATWRR